MALTKVPSNLDSVTATTQSQGDGSTNVATTAYVDTGLANLIDSAPGNLNTLNELAAAMNDNASFFSTVLPLSGGTMTGDFIVGTSPPDFKVDRTNSRVGINVEPDVGFQAKVDKARFQDPSAGQWLEINPDSNPVQIIASDQTGANYCAFKLRINNGGAYPITAMDVKGHSGAHIGFGTDAHATAKMIISKNPDSATQTTPQTILQLANPCITTASDVKVGQGPQIAFEIPDDQAGNKSLGAAIAAQKQIDDDNDSTTRLTFFTTQNDETLDEMMTILGDGKVGIGTSAPQNKLQVATSNGTYSHFGGIATTDTHYTGISLGYTEAANANYRKTAIVQEQLGDGAARGSLHFLVDTAADGNSVVLGDTKMEIHGITGDVNVANKLGIGTGSVVDTQLHIKDAGGIELRLEADSNNNGQEDCFIRFYTDGKTQEGIAGMDNNNSSTLFNSNTENAMVFGTVSNLPTLFATNNTERMQITAGGDVTIGSNSAISNARVSVHGGDMMVYGSNNSAGISNLLPGYTRGHYGVVYSTANHIYFAVGSSYISYISGGSGQYTISDERQKENVSTLTGALDKVKQLRGVNFTWKDSTNRGTDTQIGLIAQEVEQVYPELVGDGDLPNDEDGNAPMKSVNYTHLTSVLIEAIKELSEKLDAAEARITELEG